MKRKNLSVLAVPLLAVCLAGCPKGAYHDAVVAEHNFTTVLQNLQQAELAEHTNGRIDLVEHQRLEGAIGKAALTAQALVSALQAGADNTTIQQDFTTVANTLNALQVDGVFGVKNPQSQNLLALLVKTLQDILTNVGNLLAVQQTVPIQKAGN